MGHLKQLEVGILNLKIHPHNPQRYVDLMKDVFDQDVLVKVRGDDWGSPNFIKDIYDGNPTDGLIGTVYRFMQIDPHKAWLDIKSRKPIVDEKGDPVPQVSGDKKPNLREVEFAFFPNGHLLFFNSKAITPGSAQKLIVNLCNTEGIKKKYGPVDVEIVSSEEVVERILRIPTLTRLEITISRPNGDVITGIKKDFLKRMEDQGIRSYKEFNTSEKHEGIVPDEGTKALMELATTNGKVFAVGYSGDDKLIESTSPHPLIERTQYDPERHTLLRAIANFSSGLIDRIVSRG